MLAQFLRIASEREANQRLAFLQNEFLTPLIIQTLTRELRRGPSGSQSRLWAETEAFREIQATVEGNLAIRLHRLRVTFVNGDLTERPIADLSSYVRASARRACADYLRQRRPGRHALDTALRVALGSSTNLGIWRIETRKDFYEWRCGLREWQSKQVAPLSLRADETLRTRLWRELRGADGTRADSLRRVFALTSAPLLYNELVDFLAALWDVEAPYRAAAYDVSPLSAPSLSVALPTPESAAQMLGTLQEFWMLLRSLSALQKAVLLLRLPPSSYGNYLEEFVRLGITTETEMAASLGLTVEELRFQYPLLPLQDEDIATLLHIAPDEVRRIRQDARRRLQRQKSKEDREQA